MSNTFELAIKILHEAMDEAIILNLGDEIASIDASLNVLEAAGDFTADDKGRIANAIDMIPHYTPISDYKCPGQVLRDKFKALLAALPDEVKE